MPPLSSTGATNGSARESDKQAQPTLSNDRIQLYLASETPFIHISNPSSAQVSKAQYIQAGQQRMQAVLDQFDASFNANSSSHK